MPMSNSNRAMVVCVAVSQVPRDSFVPLGITQKQCEQCGTEVLVSPSSANIIARGLGELLCEKCALERIKGPGITVVAMAPGAAEEAADFRRQMNERN